MILSGAAIDAAVAAKKIEIDPYDARQLNPASYDLTLGDEIRTYEFGSIHNVKDEPATVLHKFDPLYGFVLRPGTGYLMHTRERIRTDIFVPVLDGKSSIGRLFVKVHETAGFGDPGFDGQYTLEVTTLYPIRLFARMRIAQMRFHVVEGEMAKYQGNYVGDAARGPVASRAWRQFR